MGEQIGKVYAKFTFEFEDQKEYFKNSYFSSKVTIFSYIIISSALIGIVGLLIFEAIKGNYNSLWIILVSFVGVISVVIFLLPIFLIASLKAQWDETKVDQMDYIWEISDEQVIIKMDFVENSFPWELFSKIHEYKSCFSFMFLANQNLILPKRALDLVEVDFLREIIKRKVHAYRYQLIEE